MLQVALFFLEKEEQSLARSLVASTRAAHSMDVFLDIQRRIELHDPIHLRDVQASSCYISAQQDSLLHQAELVEGRGSFLLFLLAVDVHDTDIDIVQQIREEFYAVAGREEDHDLFVLLFLEESKEELELPLC